MNRISLSFYFLFPFFFWKLELFFGRIWGLDWGTFMVTRIFGLVFFMRVNNVFSQVTFLESVVFFFFLLVSLFLLILRFGSSRLFLFLVSVECLNLFILGLVFYFSKDRDKSSAFFFIYFFNLLGSIPFIVVRARLDRLVSGLETYTFFFCSSFYFFLIFILILICKLPLMLLHCWLTKAHVSSFRVGSIVLARLILKIGSLGIFKFYQLFVFSGLIGSLFFCWGTISVGFFSIFMFRFSDLKHLIACSSIVHMSLLLGGMVRGGVLGGLSRVLIMASHGVISLSTFYLASILYECRFRRSVFFNKRLKRNRWGLSIGVILVFWVNLGLPPLFNFVSEVFFFFCLSEVSKVLLLLTGAFSLILGLYIGVFLLLFFSSSKSTSLNWFCKNFFLWLTIFSSSIIFLPLSLVFCLVSLVKISLCGSGEWKALIFLANFTYVFAMLLLILFIFRGDFPGFILRLNYISYLDLFFRRTNLTVRSGDIQFFFLLIVFFVTVYVFKFSSVYIETYANVKFFMLLASFVSSIVLLIFRERALILASGWDFLGASSVFLIFFYPNKVASFRGLVTFYFNRARDVFLILSFGLLVGCYSDFFLFGRGGVEFLIYISICRLVKRAQYPFSTWLPAAIAAPTPISALVHSSTLVTAGILIISQASFALREVGVLRCLHILCLLGVLVGGFLSISEVDLKKIVAFSTISQIRLCLVLIVGGCSILSFSHILFHAFFKSFLFRICGIFFLISFRRQLRNFHYSRTDGSLLNFMFFLRVYRITALVFSLSFWTKDLYLEKLVVGHLGTLIVAYLVSRIFTILYCSKLVNFIPHCTSMFKFPRRVSLPSFTLFFCFVILVGRVFTGQWFSMEIVYPLSTLELQLLCASLLLTSFLGAAHLPFIFVYLPIDTFFIKTLTLRTLRKIMEKDSFSSTQSDIFFFKPLIFINIGQKNLNKFFPSLFIFFIIAVFLFSI